MAGVIISGDTSGSVTLSAPAVAGTVTVTLPSTSGTMAVLQRLLVCWLSLLAEQVQPLATTASKTASSMVRW